MRTHLGQSELSLRAGSRGCCFFSTHSLSHPDTALFISVSVVSVAITKKKAQLKRYSNFVSLMLGLCEFCLRACVWAADTSRSRCSVPPLQGSRVVKQPPRCTGLFTGTTCCWVHSRESSFLCERQKKRKKNQWLISYFVLYSRNSSQDLFMGLISPLHPFHICSLPTELTASILSSLSFTLNNNFLLYLSIDCQNKTSPNPICHLHQVSVPFSQSLETCCCIF